MLDEPVPQTDDDTSENAPLAQPETATVEDILVEEVSIDGMCGVY